GRAPAPGRRPRPPRTLGGHDGRAARRARRPRRPRDRRRALEPRDPRPRARHADAPARGPSGRRRLPRGPGRTSAPPLRRERDRALPGGCAMIGAMVLAAGGSTRMGRPKMLLPFGPGTILSSATAPLLEAGLARVVVVLGADAEHVRREAALPDDPRLAFVVN